MMDRHRSNEILQLAKHKLVQWASIQHIPLTDVLFKADFADSEGIDVWVFFETEQVRVDCLERGLASTAMKYFLGAMRHFHFPFPQFPEVRFHFCSRQKVQENFNGSYAARMNSRCEPSARAQVAPPT